MKISEDQIRPKEMIQDYYRLCDKDSRAFFPIVNRRQVGCPCCLKGHDRSEELFEKSSFSYVRCRECLSIYVSPRPSGQDLERYYCDGESVKFWVDRLFKETMQSRIELTVKPKVELLLDRLDLKSEAGPYHFIDIGAGMGFLLEVLKERMGERHTYSAIEPHSGFASELSLRNINIIPDFIEKVVGEDVSKFESSSMSRIFISNELIEHLLEPEVFFNKVRGLMKPGDYFNFTGLCGSGFDIQYLLEESAALIPPHHLTFFSRAALIKMLTNNKFCNIDFETPGKLDVEIVRKSKKFRQDRLLQQLINDDTSQSFQEFLCENKLSSHMNVICQA